MKTTLFALAAVITAGSAQAGLVDFTFSSAAAYSDTMVTVAKPSGSSAHGSYDSSKLESSTLRVSSALPTKNSNAGVLFLERSTSNNGDVQLNASRFVFELNPAASVTSLGNVSVSYQARATSSGNVGSLTWTYAIASSGSTPSAGSFQAIPGASPQGLSGSFPASPYAVGSFAPGTIASGQSLYLQAQPSGFSGNHVSITFDNVSIVPEPTNIALGLFGVGALGIAAGRKFLNARRTVKR